MKEVCKGCYTFMSIHTDCPSELIKKSDKCPCAMCLIKGVCDTPCEEYSNFSDGIEIRSYSEEVKPKHDKDYL